MIYLITVATILMASEGTGQQAVGNTSREVDRLMARGLILEQVEGKGIEGRDLRKQAAEIAGREAVERLPRVRSVRQDSSAAGARVAARSGRQRVYASVPESAGGWRWWARTFLGYGRYEEMAQGADVFRLSSVSKPAHQYQAALISEKVRGDARVAAYRYREILKAWPADEPVVVLSADKLSEFEH